MQQTFLWETEVDSDDLLMLEIQQGSSAAFEELVEKWRGSIYGYLWKRTRDVEVSEELTQETLFRVYRKASLYDPQGTFRGWVFTIASHLLIDMKRRKSREVTSRKVTVVQNQDGESASVFEMIADGGTSAESQAYGCEVLQEVQDVLGQMAEEQATAWRLFYLEELTIPEIADRTSACVPTVKSRLRLAREEMRYVMECRGFGVSEQ